MQIKRMNEEFFEWLQDCPVQWVLQTDDEDSLSYMFYKIDEEPEENKEE